MTWFGKLYGKKNWGAVKKYDLMNMLKPKDIQCLSQKMQESTGLHPDTCAMAQVYIQAHDQKQQLASEVDGQSLHKRARKM